MELKIKQSNPQELKKYIHVSQIAGNLEADLLNEKQAGTLDGRIFEFYPGPLFYSGIFDTKGFELIIFKEEENYSVWDIIVPANTPAEKILRLNVNILNRLDREERDTHAAVIITGNKIVTYDNNDNRNKILGFENNLDFYYDNFQQDAEKIFREKRNLIDVAKPRRNRRTRRVSQIEFRKLIVK